MLKLFTLTLLAIVTSLSCFGQNRVAGIVTDSLTHQVLAGASLQLLPGNTYAISDPFGQFQMDKIAEGTYTLFVTYVGYTSYRREVHVPSAAPLTIALQPLTVMTEAVVVTATRSSEKMPTTYTTISKEALQKQNFGQDIPYLINWTPSVVTTSDAGTGIGYTGIRIRGSDPTRINVTINGIPYNDSESLGTFWVDIPDIASSSQSMQIQRGVGTSTNGAGAFGGTINLLTNVRSDKPYAEVINAAGSFNTRRHTFSFGTGMLNDNWSVEGRVSKIESDGFIDRGSASLSSYYFSGGYYSKKSILKAVIFGGKERTYQAWYGVPESRLNSDPEAMEITAINEGWNDIQRANLFNSGARTFNTYSYKDQVDDYQQDHFQLHFSHQLTPEFTFNSALHYTPGKGYYEEYRYQDNFTSYGLSPVTIGDSVINNTDLVRRRWLDNDFYGLTWSLNYDKSQWSVIWGGGWNRYVGDHFGEIIWAQVSPVPTGFRYYFNQGDKKDFNSFIKTNFAATSQLNLFVDLQYRKVLYEASGIENDQSPFDINADFNFFNPKAGLIYDISSQHHVYGSYAVANREPVREDFLSSPADAPAHETLHNIEAGYRNTGSHHQFQANYYLMKYKNQLVLTGELNDVGAPIRANAGESYRMGIELEGGFRLSGRLYWNANLTLSRNKIQSYTELLEDYGENFDEFNVVTNTYKDTDISFSPNFVAGSQLSFLPVSALELTLLTKYVGKQFLDNTSNNDRAIEPYLINDLRFRYTWKPTFIKEIGISFLLNNILDVEYESNGYTWGYLAGSVAYRENYYYPQAGRNFMVMLDLKF
jgi:iron complex outermembrane recepter protein